MQLADFRIALWADDKHFALDADYMSAIHRFAHDLRGLGVTVSVARPQIDPDESSDVYAEILFGMWSAGLPDEVFQAYAAAAACLDPSDRSWGARIGRGSTQTIRDWNRLGEKREQIRRVWEEFFQEYDVLVCPVLSAVAFPHDCSGVDHTAQLKRTVKVGNKEIPYLDLLLWPGVITLPKLPSTVVPIHHLVNGLPAGVQVVSAYLEDRTTLRFAQLVEDAFGGFVRPLEV
jgi:amidase